MQKHSGWRRLGGIGAVYLACVAAARSDLIASFVITDAARGERGIYDHVGFMICGTGLTVPYDPLFPIFDGLSFDNGDSGQTFSVSSDADDPDFSGLVGYLSDGIDQGVGVGDAMPASLLFLGPSYIQSQSSLFGTPGTDVGGAYAITRFELVVVNLTITSPGSDPLNDGNWTDATYSYTVNIYGTTVPEPSTLAMVSVGFAAVLGIRRRRRVE